MKIWKHFGVAFLACSHFATAIAFTIETEVNGFLIWTSTKHAVSKATILVKQGKQLISSTTTNQAGKFSLFFNTGEGIISFYAVAHPGDIVLLYSGNGFPKGFKEISPQVFQTTFFLRKI